MSRRLISLLPPLVILAGIGIFVFYFFEQRNTEKTRIAHEKSRIAEKTEVLPGASSDPEDMDRKIAEAAFSSPEQIDSAPAFSYGKPQKLNNLYGDPGTDSTSTVESIEYKPRPYEPQESSAEDQAINNSFSNMSTESYSEQVDPESKEYQERVDGLMEMRQRRLQEKAGRNEK